MTEIKPEDVERTTFTSKMRGYDPEEVDAFLGRVAAQLRAAQVQSERAYQALGEQMGDLLQHAKDRADQMNVAADSDANKMRGQAESDATRMRKEATADAAKKREEATNDAATMRSEAEGDAKKMRADATADAERTRSDAERDSTDMIARAEARVRDVENSEIQIRARLADLQSSLSDVTDKVGALADTPVPRTVPETAGALTVTAAGDGAVLEDTVTGEIAETAGVARGEVPEPSTS